MYSKFALRPHHVWTYGSHPISDRWGDEKDEEERRRHIKTTAAKYNGLPACPLPWSPCMTSHRETDPAYILNSPRASTRYTETTRPFRFQWNVAAWEYVMPARCGEHSNSRNSYKCIADKLHCTPTRDNEPSSNAPSRLRNVSQKRTLTDNRAVLTVHCYTLITFSYPIKISRPLLEIQAGHTIELRFWKCYSCTAWRA